MKERLFVFRKYKHEEGNKRVLHPKLIVDVKNNQYGYMGLTSSIKSGHHKNYEMKKNPQKGKSKKSYLRKDIRYSSKKDFSEILNDYHLYSEDKEFVINFVNEHKKKK